MRAPLFFLVLIISDEYEEYDVFLEMSWHALKEQSSWGRTMVPSFGLMRKYVFPLFFLLIFLLIQVLVLPAAAAAGASDAGACGE